MSSFLGVYGRVQQPLRTELYADAFIHDGISGHSKPHTLQLEHVLFNGVADELSASPIFRDEVLGIAVVGDIELFNRGQLRQQLGLGADSSDFEILAAAYSAYGADCVQHLNGDFAFGLWDSRKQTLFCARDPLGRVPFFYYWDKDVCLFANWMNLLSRFSIARTLNDNWIIQSLQVSELDVEETPFAKVKRLPGGHTLMVTGGSVKVSKYWNIKGAIELGSISYRDAVEGFRERLQDAVRCRLRDNVRVGMELSGGIDSISIATLSQEVLPPGDGLYAAFTNALPHTHKDAFDNFGDEWHIASRIADRLKILRHVSVEGYLFDIIGSLKRVVDVCGLPMPSVFTTSQEGVYAKAQQHGVSLLLSGFGGNEAVSQFATGRYKYNLVKKGDFGGLYNDFKRLGTNSVRALVRTGYFSAGYFLGGETRSYNKHISQLRTTSLLNDCRLNREVTLLNAFPPNQTIEERSLYSIMHPGNRDRIEAGYFFTAAYKMKYRFPLLDIPLLEYYFNLPARWKALDTNGRGIFRAAMKGKVAGDIIQKPKSFTTATFPFFKLRFESDFETMKSHLLSLPDSNKLFEYIDKRKVARAMLADDTYGRHTHYLLRVAVMFNLFFESRKDSVLYDHV